VIDEKPNLLEVTRVKFPLIVLNCVWHVTVEHLKFMAVLS